MKNALSPPRLRMLCFYNRNQWFSEPFYVRSLNFGVFTKFWWFLVISSHFTFLGENRTFSHFPRFLVHGLGAAHPMRRNSAPAAGARGGGGGPADPGSAKSLSPLLHGSRSREFCGRLASPPSLQYIHDFLKDLLYIHVSLRICYIFMISLRISYIFMFP